MESYNKKSKLKIRASHLIRLSGLSAMFGGMSFVVVGMFHQANITSSVVTNQWEIVHALATAMCFFLVLGITGIYARQAEESGWLGLVGFILYSLHWVLTGNFTFAEVTILPVLGTEEPVLAEGFVGVFTGVDSEFGILKIIWNLTSALYILGALLFGIATFRAGILPRLSAVLLSVGAGLGPLAAMLPPEHQPKVTVPVGLALAWMGYAIWSERRKRIA